MSNILEVSNVNKSFKDYRSEFQRVFSWFGLKFKSVQEHHILKNINFSVGAGESFGIVGKNGAGKSTLLKIITGTLKQSSGEVNANGRIAAILELGMGFNPDLTGRQNVYHSAGLMGYSIDKINVVIGDIADFSEIGEYFDQPVRVYSSGMQARVAFSVATAFRPDILIVDEALSVGDVYFQSKCFKRMMKFKESGTSILFVSHDTQAILTFCDRAILIHDGTVLKQGNPKEVIQKYEHISNNFLDNQSIKQEEIKTDNKVNLIEFSVLDKQGNNITSAVSGESIRLKAVLITEIDCADPHFGVRVTNRLGNAVFETNTYCMKIKNRNISKKEIFSICFDFVVDLAPGDYMFDIGVTNGGYNEKYFTDYLSMHNNVGRITIYENCDGIIFAGYYNMNPKFYIENN